YDVFGKSTCLSGVSSPSALVLRSFLLANCFVLRRKRGKVTAKKTGCGFYHEIWGILMIMVFN
ncbi:MAG: hypothetical protein ACLRLX_03525, partial [Anaerovoracaceae bacterium]